jgi:hypothetical protein
MHLDAGPLHGEGGEGGQCRCRGEGVRRGRAAKGGGHRLGGVGCGRHGGCGGETKSGGLGGLARV